MTAWLVARRLRSGRTLAVMVLPAAVAAAWSGLLLTPPLAERAQPLWLLMALLTPLLAVPGLVVE
ncbi:MAG TPA: hypothetical protein PLZ93_16500, partial [Nocardioides sp.]|nr:hypothetical protein [Nocardioides sp.]